MAKNVSGRKNLESIEELYAENVIGKEMPVEPFCEVISRKKKLKKASNG